MNFLHDQAWMKLLLAHQVLVLSAATADCFSDVIVWCAQLVDLSQSRLSGKIHDIPEDIFDMEADWEIDPKALHLLDKIGAACHMSWTLICSSCSMSMQDCRSGLLYNTVGWHT